jgi:Toprim domain
MPFIKDVNDLLRFASPGAVRAARDAAVMVTDENIDARRAEWYRRAAAVRAQVTLSQVVPETTAPAPVATVGTRRSSMLGLFLEAVESLAGTPAAFYLAARGIDLAELGRAPRALRFHNAVWCHEVGARLPALLAAITNGGGMHIATHRTWLAVDASGAWTRARLWSPASVLGAIDGGFVPVQRGATRTPLREVPDGEVVAITEAIETALALAISCRELRVLAAISGLNMARIALPDAVRTVILCPDNARPDSQSAERAIVTAIEHFAAPHRIVRLCRSPIGRNFSDMLRSGSR